MWLLLLLAAEPAPLPEGAVLIERPAVPDVAELSWGQGLPKDAGVEALSSLREAEGILLALSELDPAQGSAHSREQAMYVADEADRALKLLGVAALDPMLRVPTQARAGDAYRIVWQAVMRTQPHPDLSPEDLQEYAAELRAAGDPVAEEARAAYTRVLDDPLASRPWKAHARWGLEQLQ